MLKFTQEYETFQLDNIDPSRRKGMLSPDMMDHVKLGSSPIGKLKRDDSSGTLMSIFGK